MPEMVFLAAKIWKEVNDLTEEIKGRERQEVRFHFDYHQ